MAQWSEPYIHRINGSKEMKPILKCQYTSCSSCSSTDDECKGKCILDCLCGCYGIKGASMDNIAQIQTCLAKDNCLGKQNQCESSCRTQNCKISCYMDFMKCSCECNDAISMRPALGLSVALLALWVFQATAGK
ncbi:hypothetical protein FOCC_FOCC011935 [Frankliniella occidentalis]|nr:hypothetical protein FOCC_FOCC011935 [Frankliniella occidentalis]